MRSGPFVIWRAKPGQRPAAELSENDDNLSLGDRFTLGDQDFLDDAGSRRQHWDFHLHRFEDDERIVLGHRVADRDLELPYGAGDFASNSDFGHPEYNLDETPLHQTLAERLAQPWR